MTEPDEAPSWRIRVGGGLLSAAPLNDELREAHRKEDERERQQAEFAAQLRADAEIERNAELQRQGHRPRTQEEFLAQVGHAQDRQDAIEAKRLKAGAEAQGQPEPRLNRWEVKANVAAYEAKRETTAATKADARELQNQVTGLKGALHDLREAVAGQYAELRRKW